MAVERQGDAGLYGKIKHNSEGAPGQDFLLHRAGPLWYNLLDLTNNDGTVK